MITMFQGWHSAVSIHHRPSGSGSWLVTTQQGLNTNREPWLSPPVRTSSRCLASQTDSSEDITPLRFCLHDFMDEAGLDTFHARAARADFSREIEKLQNAEIGRDITSSLDLARAALDIAAEDDALVSHSSVPLPVDSYMERIDGMANEFAGHYLPARATDAAVFDALDNFLFVYKGFRRATSGYVADARDSYLNSVLTRRMGTPLMLALIYSELVKRLYISGATDFLAEVELPIDPLGFPHAHAASKHPGKKTEVREPSGEALQPVVLTPQLLLVEVLRSLKQLFWPWKSSASSSHGSEFLEAANAASRGTRSDSMTPYESLFAAPSSSKGADVALARAAQLRLQRGIWTSSSFGDIRRALAASERLVLLGVDEIEKRDYGMLLFHCGLYQDAYSYLSAYSMSEDFRRTPASLNSLAEQEHVAVDRLLERLRLILLEQSWGSQPNPSQPKNVPPDPW